MESVSQILDLSFNMKDMYQCQFGSKHGPAHACLCVFACINADMYTVDVVVVVCVFACINADTCTQ